MKAYRFIVLSIFVIASPLSFSTEEGSGLDILREAAPICIAHYGAFKGINEMESLNQVADRDAEWYFGILQSLDGEKAARRAVNRQVSKLQAEIDGPAGADIDQIFGAVKACMDQRAAIVEQIEQ